MKQSMSDTCANMKERPKEDAITVGDLLSFIAPLPANYKVVSVGFHLPDNYTVDGLTTFLKASKPEDNITVKVKIFDPVTQDAIGERNVLIPKENVALDDENKVLQISAIPENHGLIINAAKTGFTFVYRMSGNN